MSRYVKLPHANALDCFLKSNCFDICIIPQLYKIDAKSILFTRKFKHNLPALANATAKIQKI
jgi:hypothetical protein